MWGIAMAYEYFDGFKFQPSDIVVGIDGAYMDEEPIGGRVGVISNGATPMDDPDPIYLVVFDEPLPKFGRREWFVHESKLRFEEEPKEVEQFEYSICIDDLEKLISS